MEQRPQQSEMCCRCGVPILDSDLTRRDHGEWYHVRCQDPGPSDRLPDQPPAVLCVICRTGIGRLAEMVLLGAGPMHILCRLAHLN